MPLKLLWIYIILCHITYISNKILSTGVFPDRLKFSEVKPLYKKCNTSDFSNYRPISLLTSFSKVIEKLIHKRLYHYLDQQKVFVNEQYGFRQKTSTETAAFSLLNTILLSLDKNGGLFLDLQKAFDCVNHDILLSKLNFYGISVIVNKLLKSYIKDRYQRVVMKDKFSNTRVVPKVMSNFFFASELGTADEGEYGGRWNQLLCYP